jgi:hypothetical protein
MIKFQEIQKGDYLIADFDGEKRRGEVTNLQRESKRVMVNNGIQEFWYEENQLHPLPLNDEELTSLKFQQQQNDDGTVKYLKGAFRMMIPAKNDFSKLEIWYRDERRHIVQQLSLHQFQNHFYEMTKVHLNTDSFE